MTSRSCAKELPGPAAVRPAMVTSSWNPPWIAMSQWAMPLGPQADQAISASSSSLSGTVACSDLNASGPFSCTSVRPRRHGPVAGRGEARILADACLWVQEAETPSEVLRRATEGARLLVETSCSYCAVRDGDVLRLAAHSGFRNPETARRWRLPVG